MRVVAFHGFLGLPSDWEGMEAYPLAKEKKRGESMQDFADRLFLDDALVVGYSMGARLALHCLSKKLKGAVLIGANPKGADQKRFEQDTLWAKRFLHDPWDEVLLDWNRQLLSKPLVRYEGDFDRQVLADMLTDWSLAKQQDFTPLLETIDLPILWVVGEHDEKFKKMIPQLRHPLSRVWIAPGAGHRVPWDTPASFYQAYHAFKMAVFHEYGQKTLKNGRIRAYNNCTHDV